MSTNTTKKKTAKKAITVKRDDDITAEVGDGKPPPDKPPELSIVKVPTQRKFLRRVSSRSLSREEAARKAKAPKPLAITDIQPMLAITDIPKRAASVGRSRSRSAAPVIANTSKPLAITDIPKREASAARSRSRIAVPKKAKT